jgi:hypothetical protein
VNADPKCDPFVLTSIDVRSAHCPLELDCSVQRVDDACELNQRAITHELYESTAALC